MSFATVPGFHSCLLFLAEFFGTPVIGRFFVLSQFYCLSCFCPFLRHTRVLSFALKVLFDPFSPGRIPFASLPSRPRFLRLPASVPIGLALGRAGVAGRPLFLSSSPVPAWY